MYFRNKYLVIFVVIFLFMVVFIFHNPYSLQEGAIFKKKSASFQKNCFDAKTYKAYDKDGNIKLCNKNTNNLGENLKGCSFLYKNTNYKCDNAVYYGGYGYGIGNGSNPINRSSGIQWV